MSPLAKKIALHGAAVTLAQSNNLTRRNRVVRANCASWRRQYAIARHDHLNCSFDESNSFLPPSRVVWQLQESQQHQKGQSVMSLIRYQSHETVDLAFLRSLDQSAGRDEQSARPAHDGNFARQAQLFSGWTPVLDLYQDADNIVASSSFPACARRRSTSPCTTDMSDDRRRTPNLGRRRRKCRTHANAQGQIPSQHHTADAGRYRQSQRLLQRGVLRVTLPKAEEAKPKKVEVTIDNYYQRTSSADFQSKGTL